MSEEEITVPEVAPEAIEPDGAFDEARARAKIAKQNSENAALRARLKDAEPLAAKARELEEAQKSEAERVTERLTAAEERAQRAEAQLLLSEVAAEKGLTAAQAKRLIGKTREELLADADDFLASLPAPPLPTVQRTPVEALRPGSLPNPAPPSSDEQRAELMKDPRKNRTALIELENQKLQQIAAKRR